MGLGARRLVQLVDEGGKVEGDVIKIRGVK